ncbi:HNH endonuclease [Angustibacter sp. McL0619]|uniref:HNH endonuclease n=1 Tax=Angustibacter sp. McL0619 TaxID=3415676 RepID=UPI003CF54068
MVEQPGESSIGSAVCGAKRATSPVPPTVMAELMDKIGQRTSADGPHVMWDRTLNVGGHPVLRHRDRTYVCARVVWEQTHGPIPQGVTCRHLCEVRRCILLNHLALATWSELRRTAVSERVRRRAVPEGSHLLLTRAGASVSPPRISVSGNSGSVQRAVWSEAFGPLDRGQCIVSTCREPYCVALAHLARQCAQERGRRMVELEVMPAGEDHWNHKLTWESVDVIRRSTEPAARLAAVFHVSTSTISMVRSGKRWPKHRRPAPDGPREVQTASAVICAEKVFPCNSSAPR